MGEILAALFTGGLGLTGVLVTVYRRGGAGEAERLRGELERAQNALSELQGEARRYRAAYEGLLEVNRELLER